MYILKVSVGGGPFEVVGDIDEPMTYDEACLEEVMILTQYHGQRVETYIDKLEGEENYAN